MRDEIDADLGDLLKRRLATIGSIDQLAGMKPAELAPRLLPWYQKERRDLPWRSTRDPYAIWVSEIMLQQTTVRTVIPFYERFLNRFPTVMDLAASPLDEVLKRWAGLGYYRRARQLHAASRVVVERFSGRFPDRLDDVLSLPGVGRYTAGAIMSIAFEARVPLVDGNVSRVFSRVFAIDTPVDEARTQARLWDIAEQAVPERSPGDFNQALMELGATVCHPTSPDCARCPLKDPCQARAQSRQHEWPRKKGKVEATAVGLHVFLAGNPSEVLLIKRPESGILAGLWEPPTIENPPFETPASAISRLAEHGIRLQNPVSIGSARHAIMNFRIRLDIFQAQLVSFPPKTASGIENRLVARGEVHELGLSAVGRKSLERFFAASEKDAL